MLRTLIVGLGRAGLGLHLPVLLRLRASRTAARGRLFATAAPIAFDPYSEPHAVPADDLVLVRSLERARELLDPAETVVHVCTPPSIRLDVLGKLAELGFRKILVEKPLATEPDTLERICRLRHTAGLELVVVAHWLHSELTRRLCELTASGRLGHLRSGSFVQLKPRYGRTRTENGSHPSAFDVEVPHSAGVALRLAGSARVVEAAVTDMTFPDRLVPAMGTARVVLRHTQGATTRIFSDLTAPVRERSIRLAFEGGHATGHYPVSQDDSYAQLTIRTSRERVVTSVFEDASLDSFFTYVYQRFRDGADLVPDFELNVEVVSLLSDAKALCAQHSQHAPAALGAL